MVEYAGTIHYAREALSVIEYCAVCIGYVLRNNLPWPLFVPFSAADRQPIEQARFRTDRETVSKKIRLPTIEIKVACFEQVLRRLWKILRPKPKSIIT